eukprot:GHVR01110452.1.p1 GENE.GHVR01110452.1~~GHVR01110452.1.p1  ORF type:complete len:204 (+),score=32.19 GHVR01110452.1:159-770(+)
MTDSMNRMFHFKLVLLGDASVGKSSVVVRFAKEEFYEYQEPTIGAAFMTQSVCLGDCTVKFEIWDTAGQERYRSLAPMYYRGAGAAVVVYDITNKDSFSGAKSWVNELQSSQQHSNIVIALTGNKLDLAGDRTVSTEEGRVFAEDKGVVFVETSARTGTNVRELFLEIARQLPKQEAPKPGENFQVDLSERSGEGGWCSGCAA